MPKGPYIFSGSLAFTKALGRIGGTGDSVTDVLDLKFVVDLCQLLFVCIETLTNIFIKTTSLLPEGPFGVMCSVGGDIRGVRSVISFSTTNHHPNFNWYYSMNPRISTIASGKLLPTLDVNIQGCQKPLPINKEKKTQENQEIVSWKFLRQYLCRETCRRYVFTMTLDPWYIFYINT